MPTSLCMKTNYVTSDVKSPLTRGRGSAVGGAPVCRSGVCRSASLHLIIHIKPAILTLSQIEEILAVRCLIVHDICNGCLRRFNK